MNISVIIPIHEFNEEISTLLNNAIETVEKQEKIKKLPEVVLVTPTSISEQITDYVKNYKGKVELKKVINDGSSDFQTQMNVAAKEIKTDFFSILEFDDEYSTTHFHNVEKYIKKYKDDIDFYLTLMIEVNDKNEAIKLTNEVVWSQQFVGENGEMGYFNLSSIKQYTDFKISGGVFNTKEFLNVGGFKSNIKLTFAYEFLLRALNNACNVFTIPKIGYKHWATREGSLFDGYLKNMPMDERKFWFDVANKEYHFTNDRVIDTTKLKKIIVESDNK